MQVPGSDNAGPKSDILSPDLILQGKEKLLKKKKANDIMLGSNFILPLIFISESTLSLNAIIIIQHGINSTIGQLNYPPTQLTFFEHALFLFPGQPHCNNLQSIFSSVYMSCLVASECVCSHKIGLRKKLSLYFLLNVIFLRQLK